MKIRAQVIDTPKIKVRADIVYDRVEENGPEYGTRVKTRNIGLREIYISLDISNHGHRPIQVVSVFVRGGGYYHQIFSRNLPAVVDPDTRVSTRIQKEWLDDPDAESIGVLDALGRKHSFPRRKTSDLIRRSRELPSNRRQRRMKDSGQLVWAWQMRDLSTTATRPTL